MNLTAIRHRLPQVVKHRIENRLIARPIIRVVGTRYGFRILVDTADFLQREIYLSGDWDHAVSRVLCERLRPGDTFVDAGANIGYFSLLAAKLIGPAGRVIAFEPNPQVFARLQANIALNDLAVDARQQGLFDRQAVGMLSVPEANCGGATLRDKDDRGIAVPLVRLDDVVDGPVHLVKIDVEGAEFAALSGADRILASCPAVVCEVSEYSLRQMGASKEQLFGLMSGHGFVPRVISQIRRSNLCADAVFFQYDVLFERA